MEAAFRHGACAESKAAWRFASRLPAEASAQAGRTPKICAACYRSWRNSAVGRRQRLTCCAPALGAAQTATKAEERHDNTVDFPTLRCLFSSPWRHSLAHLGRAHV